MDSSSFFPESFYEETFASWNQVAALYEKKFSPMTMYNESYNFFCNTLQQPKAAVLEIGCGTGNITRYLNHLRPDFTIYAIDIAPEMIAIAKEKSTARFEVMDVRDIHSLTEKFHAVVGGFFLPYLALDDVLMFGASIKKCIHPNALIYLSFVEGEAAQSGFKTSKNGLRMYFNYYTYEWMSAFLNDLSFDIIREFRIPYALENGTTENHVIFIAQSK